MKSCGAVKPTREKSTNVNIWVAHKQKKLSTHLSLRVGFARLDDVRTAARVQLETVRLVAILNFSHLHNNNKNESEKPLDAVQMHDGTKRAPLTEMFSNGMMPRGSLSVVYSK